MQVSFTPHGEGAREAGGAREMGSSLVQGSSPEAFKRFVELLGRIVFLATLRRAYIKLRWAEAEEVLYCLTCLLTDLLTYFHSFLLFSLGL